jgi:uncharacterized protein
VRQSKFNVFILEHPQPGETLVYNTFTGAHVVLDAPTLAAFRKLDADLPLDAAEAALIDPAYLDEDVGILVDSRAAEDRAFDEWFDAYRRDRSTLSAIVSTTFACNLDCTYCCQADVLDGRTMSTESALATARWLAARAAEIGATTIDLSFVGGEPLLHPQRIETIVREVSRLAADRSLRFGLITNGVFLTPSLVDRWIPLGLRAAQITLDGDSSTHSITRPSKRGVDTYATIFANLIAAAPKITVTVNGNYQPDTVHGFVPLLDELRAAGLAPGTRVHFSPALAALGAPVESGSGACTWAGSSPELMLTFTDEILRRSFDPGIAGLYTVGPCAFHQDQHFAIDPDGHIYKCPGFLGKPTWAIGHVGSGLGEQYAQLVSSRAEKDACGTCAHRPSCSGGCIAAEWIKSGRAEGVNCEIGYCESQKEPLVKRMYALETAGSVEAAVDQFPPSNPLPPVVRTGTHVALRVIASRTQR